MKKERHGLYYKVLLKDERGIIYIQYLTKSQLQRALMSKRVVEIL